MLCRTLKTCAATNHNSAPSQGKVPYRSEFDLYYDIHFLFFLYVKGYLATGTGYGRAPCGFATELLN